MKTTILFTAISYAVSALVQAQQSHHVDTLEFHGTHATVATSTKLHPVVLPDGRVMLAVADSVYMLDSNGGEIWKYNTASPNEVSTSEPAFNASVGEVAIVGTDLLFVRLDATNGKLKWKADLNGRGLFKTVAAYEKGFLVIVDMSAYRMGEPLAAPADALEYWGESETDFWSTDFPVRTELLVSGNRMYAVQQDNNKSVRLLPIQPGRRRQPHKRNVPDQAAHHEKN